MSNPFKVSAETTGLNVQGNEILMPPGALAVADNVSYDRDDIIGMRFGFEKCAAGLPLSKPESMFVTGENIYVHINGQIWTSSGDCNYTQIVGQNIAKIYGGSSVLVSGDIIYIAISNGLPAAAVRKINLATGTIQLLAGSYSAVGYADGAATAARFDGIYGMALVGNNLYLADTGNYSIRKIDLTTNVVSTFAGNGTSGSADGIGAAARFNDPLSLWSDGTYLYTADSANFTIRRIEIATANVTTIAGTAGASGYVDGVGAAARFRFPAGLTGTGTNLFINDRTSYTLRKLDLNTNTVSTVAGTDGNQGLNDGIGAAAEFYDTNDITSDANYFYITDETFVRKISKSNYDVITMFGGLPLGVYGLCGNSDGLHMANEGYYRIYNTSLYSYVEILNGPVNTNIDGSFFSALRGPIG